MRLIMTLLFLLSSQSFSQMPDVKQPVLNAMKDVSVLVGEWEGKGYRLDAGGEKHWSNVKEEIEFKLDGTILQIEGIGKNDEGNVVHEAFAVLYFDAFRKVYKMDSHLASGLYTNASFEVIKPKEQMQWSFDSPMGKVRYKINITNNGTKWDEIGEFSQDGENWFKTFEMNLEKKD